MRLAEAYLNILGTRLGARLAFSVDLPSELATHSFPPNLLISLVENGVKHGIEPAADGGSIHVAARRVGDALVVMVEDTGRGLATPAQSGQGVGLANIRERLAALYGAKASFKLAALAPRGTCATLAIPLERTRDSMETQ
jgi:LytS/YehU family sensor histidine kinase